MKNPVTNLFSPTISIIIPTTGSRTSWLLRAVESCIAGWHAEEVEVIVVLNGNINRYEDLQKRFTKYPQVVLIISEPKGVCRARNVGLSNAKGQLVRFLDDDDYLYPAIAVEQSTLLLESEAHFSSYAIELINDKGQLLDTRNPLAHRDCVMALTLPTRLQLVHSFVYKRMALQNVKWNEDLSLAEDTAWLIGLLCSKEHNWIYSNSVVGAWFQHAGGRLSQPYSTHFANKTIGSCFELLSLQLEARNSLISERKIAIAKGMCSCYVAGFKYSPIFWSNFYQKIITLDKDAIPNSKIYRYLNHIGISPLFASWLLLPAFWTLFLTRQFASRLYALRQKSADHFLQKPILSVRK